MALKLHRNLKMQLIKCELSIGINLKQLVLFKLLHNSYIVFQNFGGNSDGEISEGKKFYNFGHWLIFSNLKWNGIKNFYCFVESE